MYFRGMQSHRVSYNFIIHFDSKTAEGSQIWQGDMLLSPGQKETFFGAGNETSNYKRVVPRKAGRWEWGELPYHIEYASKYNFSSFI